MISIKKAIAAFIIIFAMSVGLGYFWAFESYEPLKLAQEIKDLQAEVQQCQSAWTREFSREHGLIEGDEKWIQQH